MQTLVVKLTLHEMQQVRVWHADRPYLFLTSEATAAPGIAPIRGTALELVAVVGGVTATTNDSMPMPTPRQSRVATARYQNSWGIPFSNAQRPDTLVAAMATALPTTVFIRGTVLEPTW